MTPDERRSARMMAIAMAGASLMMLAAALIQMARLLGWIR